MLLVLLLTELWLWALRVAWRLVPRLWPLPNSKRLLMHLNALRVPSSSFRLKSTRKSKKTLRSRVERKRYVSRCVLLGSVDFHRTIESRLTIPCRQPTSQSSSQKPGAECPPRRRKAGRRKHAQTKLDTKLKSRCIRDHGTLTCGVSDRYPPQHSHPNRYVLTGKSRPTNVHQRILRPPSGKHDYHLIASLTFAHTLLDQCRPS